MIIKSENTAISQGVAYSAQQIGLLENKTAKVLDFGCGKLRNFLYLKKLGFENLVGYDIPVQIQKNFKKYSKQNFSLISELPNETKYDVILISFVLNVLLPKEREQALKKIYNLLDVNGKIYIEVRSVTDIQSIKNPIPYEDGVLTSNNENTTFQKGYKDVAELKSLLEQNGFKVLFGKQKSKSIFIIGAKDNE